ncbi:hypothetical protein PAJ_0756 [Pantoea ananatis AJ13355]|uniref:Uncharacterized protein n=1 Tax=Pantoea ananatis (strain AJ13355) TaxID=932677 RepID=A0A0H3KUW2_PANAA|nr:hypothetical protein [Pantoea ananatis]BAK10836.1 hypothetical protein PAJ_0756 [Pantoea ananatis AJ13355]
MTYYLREINFEAIGSPEREPAKSEKHKTIVARCLTENLDDCDILQQINDLELGDAKAALTALVKLIQVAASGLPFTNFYDEKQCHETHSFTYNHKIYKVWRLRQRDVRITFFHCEGKTVLLTHVFVKHKDKLTNKQKAMLEEQVKTYIDASTQGLVQIIESKK